MSLVKGRFEISDFRSQAEKETHHDTWQSSPFASFPRIQFEILERIQLRARIMPDGWSGNVTKHHLLHRFQGMGCRARGGTTAKTKKNHEKK
jgi:hypothetical protein